MTPTPTPTPTTTPIPTPTPTPGKVDGPKTGDESNVRLWTAIAAVTLLVSFAAFGLSYRYQAKQLAEKDTVDIEVKDNKDIDLFVEEDIDETSAEDSDEQKEE